MTPFSNIQCDAFLPYMRDVNRCEQTLQELNLMWRLIDASAKMNCPDEAKTILASLAATRAGFSGLERALVTTLVQEKVANVQRALATKAQYVIDIIVRNLFERTADVGFLATDSELCAFVAGLQPDRAAAQARLRQYRSKYTVYDDIILLDLDGNVVARIDDTVAIERSVDPLLAATLASNEYVETFRASELRPGKERALIYSRRMHHPQTAAVVGILCLCFNFEEEMAGIFRTHADRENHTVMLLLDATNQVLASSEPHWIGTGSAVPANPQARPVMQPFCGRQYLVHTVTSPGYQGYPGPAGWQGQVMVPVDIAFSGAQDTALDSLAPQLAAGLLSHSQSFCPPLHDILKAITTASSTIQRIVWNGQLLTASRRGEMQKLKSILDQISETGKRSNELFSQSGHDLFETVLASGLRDAEFTAHLLVDLIDRNLYERSDDCRWWALTMELRAALAAPERDGATVQKLDGVLSYINGLYTVYTRIYLYDRHGVVIASTGTVDRETVVGSRIDEQTLASVQRLTNDQQYHVSTFGATPFSGGESTYTYHAALRAPDSPHGVVGGIGIVFDARQELFNMLKGVLGDRTDGCAFYVNRAGCILSGTDPKRPIGTHLPVDADLLQLQNGESVSKIVIHDGQYAIVGCSVSNGYREFKVTDGYSDDVIAVVYHFLGAVVPEICTGIGGTDVLEADATHAGGVEYATFFAGKNLLAIPATCVLQALPCTEMAAASVGSPPQRIGLLNLRHGGRDFIWVFDLVQLMGGANRGLPPDGKIIVVEYGTHAVGLLVDELHAVPQFAPAQIIEMPFGSLDKSVLVTQVIKANDGELLIQLLDVRRLFAVLLGHELLAPADASPRLLSAA